MKIIVTGSSSKLGCRVVELAKRRGFEVVGLNLALYDDASKLVDIRDKDSVLRFVKDVSPDYIVHTAAVVSPETCEIDKPNCTRTNLDGTRYLAEASQAVGAKMASISSDYVFDGKSGPYAEDAPTNPIIEYGHAKLAAEKALGLACPNSVSLRSCVLYDWNLKSRRQNFLVWLVQKVCAGEKVSIVDDQFATPTFIPQFADVILKLLESDARGVYNVSGPEWIDRYHFSIIAAEVFGLDKSLIEETDSTKFRQVAKRPLKAGLKVGKVEKKLGIKMLSCREGLEICKKIKDGSMGAFGWLQEARK